MRKTKDIAKTAADSQLQLLVLRLLNIFSIKKKILDFIHKPLFHLHIMMLQSNLLVLKNCSRIVHNLFVLYTNFCIVHISTLIFK